MIAQLTGNYTELSIDAAILDVNGVGYHVLVPVGTQGRLKKNENGQVTISVHTHVREDAIQLFGFAAPRDKTVFLKLTSVSGVGPKLALAVLSHLSSDDVITAVANDDLARFTAVSGIGKKTAQRLLLELKSAFKDVVVATTSSPTQKSSNATWDDLRSALLNLGYKPVVVDSAVDTIAKEETDPTDVEPLLRRALQLLS